MSKLQKKDFSFIILQIVKLSIAMVFIGVFVLFFTAFFSNLFHYVVTPKPIPPLSWNEIFLNFIMRIIYVSIWGFIFAHIFQKDRFVFVIISALLGLAFSVEFVYAFMYDVFNLIKCNSSFVAYLSETMAGSLLLLFPALSVFLASAFCGHIILNKREFDIKYLWK